MPNIPVSRRVVVTGIGLICSVGNDTDSVWQAILAGKNGIERITLFDPSQYPCQIAGEVKNFDPATFIDKKEIKKMGRFMHFAIAAADNALAMSGLKITPDNAEEIGVYIGSGIGGFEVIEREHLKLLAGGRSIQPEQLSENTLLQHIEVPYAWQDWCNYFHLKHSNGLVGPRFDQYSLIIKAAMSGFGIGLVPACLVEDELTSGRLVNPFPAPYAARQGYYLCAKDDRGNIPTVNALRSWLLCNLPDQNTD